MPRNPLLRLPAASARTWPGADAIIAVPCAIFGLVVASATAVAVAEPSADGEDRVRIDTMIVTGTRIEQTTAETGSTVHIIDADEIAALGFSHALDAVARAPGVTVNQNGTFGGAATVRIRGASSAQTLVLIDGVSVNDASSPGGGFNFARLDTGNIERIEILSGPQSTLWGADAIGGVVSITTRRPGQGLGGSLFAQAGSYGTFRGGASVSHGGGAGDFRLAATRLNTDGVSRADKRNGNTEDDGLETLTLSAPGRAESSPGRPARGQPALERLRIRVRQFPLRRPGQRGRRR